MIRPADTAVVQSLWACVSGLSDEELKACVVATYAMGQFTGDQQQAAKKAVLYLQKAFPQTPHLSLFQGSQYQADCARCLGAGTVEQSCARCDGSGACKGCRGRGTITRLNNKADRCVVCSGSGQCSYCKGTRRASANCTQCLGQRRVFSKDLMRGAYVRLIQQTAALALRQERAARGLVEFEGQWVAVADRQRELDRRAERQRAQQAEEARMQEEQARAAAEESRRQAEAAAREAARLAAAREAANGGLSGLRALAEQGDAAAQYKLGVRYDSGQGVGQDGGEAAKWYRKAADQGCAPAQYNLGVCYANGQGVAKDLRAARDWFARAAAAGSRDAAGALLYIGGGPAQALQVGSRDAASVGVPEPATADAPSVEAQGGLPQGSSLRKQLPAYAGGELAGRHTVRVRNPNEFSVEVGLRSEGRGRDFDVPTNDVREVGVPNGRYDIYFVYSDRTNALFQGDSFSLNNNGVEIQIVKVADGNFDIRQVR
jgi:TPR repeat protein